MKESYSVTLSVFMRSFVYVLISGLVRALSIRKLTFFSTTGTGGGGGGVGSGVGVLSGTGGDSGISGVA